MAAMNYSFVCMLISPLRLIFTSKFICFLYMLILLQANRKGSNGLGDKLSVDRE